MEWLCRWARLRVASPSAGAPTYAHERSGGDSPIGPHLWSSTLTIYIIDFIVTAMSDELHGYDDVVLPSLLGAARRTYVTAIRASLATSGFDDMPRSGSAVLGRIARSGHNLRDVASDLAVSKQAASQLVDALVARGYVERTPDPDDRRRVTVGLTERGHAAAVEIRMAVEQIDAELATKVSHDDMARTRAVLGALVNMGHDES